MSEGLRLQACAPDFDLYRWEGRLACNDDTIVINADINTRACPGTLPYSLLDCVKTVQFDAGVETLVFRQPTQKMHFGQATWEEACATELVLPDIVRVICSSLAEYTLIVPKPADIGSTSLVTYDFLPGYGCYGASDLQEPGHVLSRKEVPNRVVTCPQVANGTRLYVSLYLCRLDFAEQPSPTGPEKRCKEVTAAHVGCHCSGFPGSFLSGALSSYGSSTVARTSGRGHVAEV